MSPYDVTCPRCDVGPTQPCVDRNGRPRGVHAMRKRAARNASQ